MGGDQLKSESAAGDWHPTDDALSTGMRPAVVSTIVARPPEPVSGPADEAEIRHHERQLIALELLVLAGHQPDPAIEAALRFAASKVNRREIA